MKILPKKINKKGFVLIWTILISSLLMNIALSISFINLVEFSLTSKLTDSQQAFYSARSGNDCAIYWELSSKALSFGAPHTITCNGQNITVGGGISDFEFDYFGQKVEVNATTTDLASYDIKARAYNTYDENSPSRIQKTYSSKISTSYVSP